MTETISMVLTASANHHFIHVASGSVGGWARANPSGRNPPPTANEALIVAVAAPMSTNFAMSGGLVKVLRPCAQRSVIDAPANAASVIPMPMNAGVSSALIVVG